MILRSISLYLILTSILSGCSNHHNPFISSNSSANPLKVQSHQPHYPKSVKSPIVSRAAQNSPSEDRALKSYLNKCNHRGYYKLGKSYTVNKVTYKPQDYSHYDRVGVASWYGSGFHSQLTANGEIFSKHEISAAHPTLPLPSLVEVTNLENGRKLIIKINDRGPFASNRIIDLSEEAARILGFHKRGVTTIRVRYLKSLSQRLINSHPHYKRTYERAKRSSK